MPVEKLSGEAVFLKDLVELLCGDAQVFMKASHVFARDGDLKHGYAVTVGV